MPEMALALAAKVLMLLVATKMNSAPTPLAAPTTRPVNTASTPRTMRPATSGNRPRSPNRKDGNHNN
jgi:hypothetical protein